MDKRRCVVYDVEIAKSVEDVPGKWSDPEGMGFASAVAYDYLEDRYHFFLHEEQKEELLNLFRDRIVVTFNGVRFDSRVVLGNDRGVVHYGKLSYISSITGDVHWSEFDVLLNYVRARFGCNSVQNAEKILGNRSVHDGTFSLDGLSEGTLGLKKIGHGAHAPLLYQEGKYAELLAYNLHDVRLTRELFDFMLEYNFLVDRADRVVRF